MKNFSSSTLRWLSLFYRCFFFVLRSFMWVCCNWKMWNLNPIHGSVSKIATYWRKVRTKRYNKFPQLFGSASKFIESAYFCACNTSMHTNHHHQQSNFETINYKSLNYYHELYKKNNIENVLATIVVWANFSCFTVSFCRFVYWVFGCLFSKFCRSPDSMHSCLSFVLLFSV